MLNTVVIGAGFVGDQHANAAKNSKRLNLLAIVDANADRAKAIADKYDVKYYTSAAEMFEAEKPDIADICLPTFLHEEYVLLAARYRVNILCEKPVALTLESMDKMIAAAKDAGVEFMVAQVVRFWPEYVAIKELYDEGVFGEIKMVYAARLAQHPDWTQWHKDPKNSGGGLFDLHLHDIDFVSYIFGDVKSVYATGWRSETGCWNHVMSVLKFKNGVNAVVEGAFDMTENFPFTMKLRIVGETTSVDYNLIAGFNLEDVASSTRSAVYYENGKDPRKLDVNESEDAYQTEMDYFAACIEDGKPILTIPIEKSREVVRIMLAIKESLETGKVVDL
ncbi:oxidoreductase [Clostridia bacterium]|nr:oxidoreductase [Clostridia bacterium]